MKTIIQFAELIEENELHLAPGGETTLLGCFVEDFDYTENIIAGVSAAVDYTADYTDDFRAYEKAYNKIAEFDKNGTDYDLYMLWD